MLLLLSCLFLSAAACSLQLLPAAFTQRVRHCVRVFVCVCRDHSAFLFNETEYKTEDDRRGAGREGDITVKPLAGLRYECEQPPLPSLPHFHFLTNFLSPSHPPPVQCLQSYFLLACRLSEPALCQCIRLIQSPVHRHSNVMTHDIQLMLFPRLGSLGQ